MGIIKKEPKNQKETCSIAIIFSDGHREYHDATFIRISDGCLFVVEPIEYSPCEVHGYPLSSIQSFIFDLKMADDKRINVDLSYENEHTT